MESEDSGGGTADTSTYQVLAAQDSYPKQICQFDEPSLSIPFVPLNGEYAQFVGRTSDGLIALSNYRVFLQQRDVTYHIPLGVIEGIECREIFFLFLLCKDTKSYKCTFGTNEQCAEWQRRLTKALLLPQRLENVFAFAFYMWSMEEAGELHNNLSEPDGLQSYGVRVEKMFDEEVRRLGFDLGGAWRISLANSDYQLCSTYPRKLVVPASINDNILESVARFRSARRIPAVVWRHANGAVIARCSQPEVGWLGWRSSEDEDLVKAIAEACAYDSPPVTSSSSVLGTTTNQLGPPDSGEKEAMTPSSDNPSICDLPEAKAQADIKKVLIVDARSYTTAVANRARGGGCECPEYYPQCEIQFMNLANIHTIRKSHHALRQLVSSPPDIPNWLSLLEGSRWLGHLSGLMKAAVTVVQAIDREVRPVLVHCSDGWDRTSQITALAQLLMDPYYRTIHGFQVLIEREWVEFGHKFSDRCGVGRSCEDINERCPVFLQWLDCVHHLLYWYPTHFQFNQAYLVKLAQHVYSNLFGTFLCNTSQERVQAEIGDRTYSVWSLLRLNRHRYTNYLYCHSSEVLSPACHTKDLRLWTSVYMPEMGEVTEDPNTGAHINGDDEEEEEEPAAGGELVKTKSCDDLLANTSPPPHHPLRRSSDPNIRDSCPNMAMLNSALGAELANGDADAVVENGNEEPGIDDFDAYEDSTSEPNGERLNDESESLTLCEPSVSESEIHECVNVVQSECSEHGIENGEEASEVLGQELAEIDEDSSKEMIEDFRREQEEEMYCNRHRVSGGHRFRGLAEQSIEGSTDTLVAEVGVIASEEKVPQEKNSEYLPLLNGEIGQENSKSLLNGKCCPFMNGMSGEENEVCTTTNNNRKPYKKGPVSSVLENGLEERLEKRIVNGVSNVSAVMNSVTSSGCSICIQSKKLLDETSNGDSWRSAGLMQDTSVIGGTVRGVTTGPGSRVSLYSTPMHSRTPSSCIPSTPCEDRFGSGGDSSRGNNYATVDGLHNVSDEVTKRLHQILLHHQSELETLKRDLQATRQALCNQVLHNRCHHHHHDPTEDQMSLPESVGSGSGGSVGQESGVSDTSWEAVEEGEARPTLWVPDHAVDSCTGCNTQFWIGRRKHHCRSVSRSCGKIFCSECSEHSIPIPREQLYQPVRVCGSCFNIGMEHTKPKILAAASN
ncbi:LOW QUALITY PROTEIN: phosphatidylinositol-3,5-bisphosphate 3-phosphatase MTMR3 [Procambarus clarkii]|uniref:LOW QUALITY PROTEIN: phosphatidylinositol-3,5-bisphosphate 3-phosphatase MTMR3 n=1 Tax=Procambarus clarkii TaxID=6728 RepID=UPI001E672CF5|nr:myotubularin-related protein 4-like isoform X3 [Procambarus clarkii]XP_045615011.1 myotubularin-related protein 4-like isoform X3 [Procambarus clarkii]